MKKEEYTYLGGLFNGIGTLLYLTICKWRLPARC